MAAPTYGSYQPGAVDPWPIESVLAKEAITSPADAQGMLSSYAQQRQAQGYSYGQQAEQQHEFAKQQLAQQMAEARLKAIPEFLARGQAGAELIAPGAGLGLGDTLNADAAARSLQASRVGEFAKNFAEQGKGAESFSRAGQDVALQQIPGLQSLKTTGQGEHSDISVERIKADTALKTAAMHAKAAGAGGALFGSSFDVPNAYGGTDHVTASRKATPAQIDAYRQSRGMRPVDAGASAQALPDPGGAQSTARSRTSLPPASTPPQNATSGVAAAQQQVLANEGKLRSHPSYPDYLAGKAANGGKPLIKIEGGKPVLYGGSGNPL